MNKFKHCDKLDANPLMCLIIGATGCGKTWLLFQMLTTEGILDFEKLVIYTTTLEQPYFQLLKHGFQNGLSKSTINSLFKAYEELNMRCDQIPEFCFRASHEESNRGSRVEVLLTNNMKDLTSLNDGERKPKTLVIFDDCVTNSNQQTQREIFTRGRHNNCQGIYLSQNFYGLDRRYIRKNANIFILFSQSQRSLTAILQDIDHGMERSEFKELAANQWYNPKEFRYILINTRKPRDRRCSTDIFSH